MSYEIFPSGKFLVAAAGVGQSLIELYSTRQQNSLFCSLIVRRDFFICWITLPADLKNWDFKKKKKRILPDTTTKLFVFGIFRNH